MLRDDLKRRSAASYTRLGRHLHPTYGWGGMAECSQSPTALCTILDQPLTSG